jgi:hypothetical protein
MNNNTTILLSVEGFCVYRDKVTLPFTAMYFICRHETISTKFLPTIMQYKYKTQTWPANAKH